MDTGDYIKAKEIIFMAAGMSGDKDFKNVPKQFYISIISDAFRELNMESKFLDAHVDIVMPKEHLSIVLPSDCFNVLNVYVFDGDHCTFEQTKKLWWKHNYFTNGRGYVASDKGYNGHDPYYTNHHFSNKNDKSLIRYDNSNTVNQTLFYNIQNGLLMLSSSCKKAGAKIHIHYNSTGCDVDEAPVIPRFFKTAIEDYTTETALRFRMANEPANARTWASFQQIYERRLDKEGMNGSWFNAIQRVKKMSTAEKSDLFNYLGKAAWATGR